MTDQSSAARAPILRYFAYDHLPAALRPVAAPIASLAFRMDRELPNGPEKSAGLRKLLEAKDCFVRAALDATTPDTEAKETP